MAGPAGLWLNARTEKTTKKRSNRCAQLGIVNAISTKKILKNRLRKHFGCFLTVHCAFCFVAYSRNVMPQTSGEVLHNIINTYIAHFGNTCMLYPPRHNQWDGRIDLLTASSHVCACTCRHVCGVFENADAALSMLARKRWVAGWAGLDS